MPVPIRLSLFEPLNFVVIRHRASKQHDHTRHDYGAPDVETTGVIRPRKGDYLNIKGDEDEFWDTYEKTQKGDRTDAGLNREISDQMRRRLFDKANRADVLAMDDYLQSNKLDRGQVGPKSQQRIEVLSPEWLRLWDEKFGWRSGGMLKEWATHSSNTMSSKNMNKENHYAPILQHAMEREFGVEFHGPKKATDEYNEYKTATEKNARKMKAVAGVQAFLRQMYYNTQEQLDKRGISEVTVYRGTKFGHPEGGHRYDGTGGITDDALVNPVSSWSLSLKHAMDFADQPPKAFPNQFMANPYKVVYATRVSAARILSLWDTGFGKRNEREVVLIGGRNRAGKGLRMSVYSKKRASPEDWMKEEDVLLALAGGTEAGMRG